MHYNTFHFGVEEDHVNIVTSGICDTLQIEDQNRKEKRPGKGKDDAQSWPKDLST